MNKLLPFIFLVLFSINTVAQETPEMLIEEFATNLSEVSTDSAVSQLFSTNQWMSRNLDAIDQLSRQLSNMLPLLGNFVGKELITKKQAGESLVLYSYMFKYERQPIRFNFVFYKPTDEWVIYKINYDDEMDDELIEAATLYFLDLN